MSVELPMPSASGVTMTQPYVQDFALTLNRFLEEVKDAAVQVVPL